MSRVDHIVLRRMVETRHARVVFEHAGPGRRRASVYQAADGKRYATLTAAHHRQGLKWWRSKFADMVERREFTDLPAWKSERCKRRRRKVKR